jgi:prevent-host-death family protein
MGIRELRDNLTAAVRRVRAGETVEVTHDGAPVAVLTGIPPRKVDRLILVGDASEPVPLTSELRRFPVASGRTASAVLEDDRAGR